MATTRRPQRPERSRPPRRRARNLLSAYYGGDVGQEGGDAEPVNPLDVDSAHFDNDQYVRQLLRTKTLPELMRHENRMVKEVRQLDSEMQTLVYQNYNRFITATDTIRQMKQQVEGMIGDIEALETNMGTITTSSDALSGALRDNRASIKSLSGTCALLRKMQFLTDLPGRIGKAMEVGAWEMAVRLHVQYVPVVERYAHMPALSSVAETCRELRETLLVRLQERLAAAASMEELGSTMGLLMDLEEDVMDLREAYLAKQRVALGKRLAAVVQQIERGESSLDQKLRLSQQAIVAGAAAAAVAPEGAAGGGPGGEGGARSRSSSLGAPPSRLFRAIVVLDRSFLGSFLDFYQSYDALFIRKHNPDGDAHERLIDLSRDVFVDYFAYVKARVTASEEDVGALLNALGKVATDIGIVNDRVSGTHFPDRVDEIISKALHSFVDAHCGDVQAAIETHIAHVVAILTTTPADHGRWYAEDLAAELDARLGVAPEGGQAEASTDTDTDSRAGTATRRHRRVGSTVSMDSESTVGRTVTAHGQSDAAVGGVVLAGRIARLLLQTLAALQALTDTEASPSLEDHLPLIATSVQANVQQALLATREALAKAAAEAVTGAAGGPIVLALMHTCTQLEQEMVGVVRRAKRMFPMSFDLLEADVLARGLHVTARALAQVYVGATVVELGDALAAVVASAAALQPPFPEAVSDAMHAALAAVDSVTEQVTSVLPGEGAAALDLVRRSAGGHGAGGAAFGDEFDVMFDTLSSTFSRAAVTLDCWSVLECVLGVALKTMTEHVRMCTLSGVALAQLQVDLACFSKSMLRSVHNHKPLEALVRQAVESARVRCTHPQQMLDPPRVRACLSSNAS